jgi:Na+/H+-translocating membrane pyrophosphatase
MKNKIAIGLSLIITVIALLQLVNNGLDLKYLVEPFEGSSQNINELVNETSKRYLNNSYSLIMIVIIHVVVHMLLFKNRKS